MTLTPRQLIELHHEVHQKYDQRNFYKWVEENEDYDMAEYQWLEEHIIVDESSWCSNMQVDLYCPIKTK